MFDPPDVKIDLDKLKAHREAALRAAGGKNLLLAELAREVQAGRITLRDAAGSSAYRDAFAQAAGGLLKTMRQLSIEDIRKTAEEQTLDEAIAGLSPTTRRMRNLRSGGRRRTRRTATTISTGPSWRRHPPHIAVTGEGEAERAPRFRQTGSGGSACWLNHG